METCLFIKRETEQQRFARVFKSQQGKLKLIAVLLILSAIEFGFVLSSYYFYMPSYLITINVFCLLCNAPLIWWLASLYLESRRNDKERMDQYFKRSKTKCNQ